MTTRQTARKIVKVLAFLAGCYYAPACFVGAILAVIGPDLWPKVVPLLLQTAALFLVWWVLDDSAEAVPARSHTG